MPNPVIKHETIRKWMNNVHNQVQSTEEGEEGKMKSCSLQKSSSWNVLWNQRKMFRLEMITFDTITRNDSVCVPMWRPSKFQLKTLETFTRRSISRAIFSLQKFHRRGGVKTRNFRQQIFGERWLQKLIRRICGIVCWNHLIVSRLLLSQKHKSFVFE